jgi:two-component system NtrC family response regulator
MTKPLLLLVEDDEDIRAQMQWALKGDYDVSTASDRQTALAAFNSSQPAVTLLDLGLPPRPNEVAEGMAILASILSSDPLAKVIVVSGQGEKRNALDAVGAGAYDFLCKPVDNEELGILLRRCIYVAQLQRDYHALQQAEPDDVFEGMLGSSPQMRAVFTFVRKVAPTTAPVLILGESGTGKEMVAQAVHRRSGRSEGPFLAINCSAIPENLIESELFGHEKGAFTGAHAQRKGLIETASAGTLFLDEIGELPAPVQVKLLRFLQEKRFQRVGGRQEIHIDARVVAATSVNLQESVANGAFREDLYFRLAVVVVKLPPLRKREGDIEAVARAFLHRYGRQQNRRSLSFSADALRALSLYRWPGNIRELQNRVQRAVIMAEGKVVGPADLELADALATQQPATLRELREAVEREAIEAALRRHRGKVTGAAIELGVSRPTLYELMEKLNIPRE